MSDNSGPFLRRLCLIKLHFCNLLFPRRSSQYFSLSRRRPSTVPFSRHRPQCPPSGTSALPFLAVLACQSLFRVSPETMENLPDDVLSNIFIRLRAKQLAQMRCICKSWNAQLSQSSFIKSHLDRSIHNNDGILLFLPTSYPFDLEHFTTRPSGSSHIEPPKFIKLPVDIQSIYSRIEVIGSVNGLICFKYCYQKKIFFQYTSNYNSEVINIWNPSLSAVLTLPPNLVSSSVDNWTTIELFRFGFDPKTDDYKIVKSTEGAKDTDFGYDPRTGEHFAFRKCQKIEVYSMRKGSWKLITEKIPSHLTMGYNPCDICLNDYHPYLHWLGKTEFGGNSEHVIVAFDLSKETFHEIPLPDSIRHDEDISKNLGVLGGKVCVMSTVPSGECEVWVMGEYRVAESWVKHHVFPPFSGSYLFFKSHGFTLHSEFLFQVDELGVALYDPIAATNKNFKFHGGYRWGGKVVEYVDSLVWVTPAKQQGLLVNNWRSTILMLLLDYFLGIWVKDWRFRTLIMLFVGRFWVLVKKRLERE